MVRTQGQVFLPCVCALATVFKEEPHFTLDEHTKKIVDCAV